MNSVRAGYKMTELGEIPSDWDFKSLKDICYIKGRIGWQGLRKDEFISEGPYLITGINFDRGKIIWNECYHITNERYEQAPEIQLKVGDVLMTKDGTIGKLLYVDNLPDKASLNSHLFVMRPINDSFISKYFYYHLQSEKFKKYIDNNKTGSTMPAITQAAMEKYKLILPPLEEQEKIASILSTVDEQIDNVEALIKKNKELKKGLMQTLLTKGIGHTKFKKTEIGEIPEEWEVKELDLIGEIITGSTPKTSEKDNYGNEYLWVSPGDLGIKKYVTNTVKMLSDKGFSKTRKLPKGAILVTCIGSTIGKMGISKTELSTNQQINSIICNDKVNSEFIYYALNYNFNMYTSFISTQAVPIINKTTFGKFLIQVPNIREQIKIASVLSEVDEKLDEYENRKQKLEELKRGLMQQLLTGNIRII